MALKADPHRFDDLFAAFGRITLRRMFGGEGIFVNGLIVGIVVRDQIYLKTDEATRAAYKNEGCKPFIFKTRTKKIASSYFAIPDRLYDEPDELAAWARQAHAVSLAKPKKKK